RFRKATFDSKTTMVMDVKLLLSPNPIVFEIEIGHHDESEKGPDQWIRAVYIPLMPRWNGEQRMAISIQDRLFSEGQKAELAETLDHELREVLLLSLGYSTKGAHKKALDDAKNRVPMESYQLEKPQFPSANLPRPGAAHQSGPPSTVSQDQSDL